MSKQGSIESLPSKATAKEENQKAADAAAATEIIVDSAVINDAGFLGFTSTEEVRKGTEGSVEISTLLSTASLRV